MQIKSQKALIKLLKKLIEEEINKLNITKKIKSQLKQLKRT